MRHKKRQYRTRFEEYDIVKIKRFKTRLATVVVATLGALAANIGVALAYQPPGVPFL